MLESEKLMPVSFYEDVYGILYNGDSKEILLTLDADSVDLVVTSPPYWALRDYHQDGQLGQEPMFKDYISNLVSYFDLVYPVLKDTGSLWVNLGDTYYGSSKGAGGSGSKSKKQTTNKGSYYNKGVTSAKLDNSKVFKNKELPDRSLCLIPSRFAIAMQERGWVLRNDIIWHKPNKMPESAKNRFTNDYEHFFFFTKSVKGYYFEQQLEPAKESSIKRHNYGWKGAEDTKVSWSGNKSYVGSAKAKEQIKKGRNKRSVWSINTEPVKGLNHFAKYPTKLIEPIIKSCSPVNGIVMDIFFGAGTTALVAEKLNRRWVGLELSKEYCNTAIKRILSARGIDAKT